MVDQEQSINNKKTGLVSRRTFLKTSAVVAVAAAVPETVRRLSDLVSKDEPLLDTLKNSVENSKRIKEIGDSEAVLELNKFLENIRVASEYFAELHEHDGKIDEIRGIYRSIFTNEDIDVDGVIFFLRDEKILANAITQLNDLDWDSDKQIEESVLGILRTPPVFNNTSDQFVDPKDVITTPANIAEIYSKAGKEKEKINTAKYQVYFLEEVSESREEIELLVTTVTNTLDDFGFIPNTRVLMLPSSNASMPFFGHVVQEFREDSFRIELGLLNKPEEGYILSDDFVKTLVKHEGTHTFDINNWNSLVKYLSVGDMLDLTFLRAQATKNTTIPDAAKVFLKKSVRGAAIDGRNIDGINNNYWMLQNLTSNPVSSQEFDILTNIYPEDKWGYSGMLDISEPVYRLSEVQREFENLHGGPKAYDNWDSFLAEEAETINAVIEAQQEGERIIEFVTERLHNFSEELVNLGYSSPASWSYYWYSVSRLIIAQDLIQSGEVKNYVPSEVYEKWLADMQYSYLSTSAENFAEEVSIYHFLNERGLAENIKDRPSVLYYELAREVLLKRNT